ncbi:hypothetical protein KO561_06765 [Radiobacillus kanasensis]|uniref:hypothetical protein n=1 Tax=Radiobacillus kanasensis TaxID=2844358 RepID=UPI001E2C16E0|nr:hypothetical protein [Radiobacillus kanasensis]UFU00631.1 hypothetical protein KO561_06765 [Radiobacillus kanasensis]
MEGNLKQILSELKGIKTDIGELKGIKADIGELKGIKTDIGELKGIKTDIGELKGIKTDIEELKMGQARLEAGQQKLQKNLIESLGTYTEKITEHVDDKTEVLNKRVYKVESKTERLSRQ